MNAIDIFSAAFDLICVMWHYKKNSCSNWPSKNWGLGGGGEGGGGGGGMPWWGWKWGWGMVFSVQNRFKVTKVGHFWMSKNYVNWVRLIPLIITKCSCHWHKQCIVRRDCRPNFKWPSIQWWQCPIFQRYP